MGTPIVTVRVGGSGHGMFFDAGARISCFQDDSLAEVPPAGSVTDFYPGVGRFQTETHEVPVPLGGVAFTLRCGGLPGLLGMTLMMAGTRCIVGNAIRSKRSVGCSSRAAAR